MGPRAGLDGCGKSRLRSPGRPARSESLYRLSYPGPHRIMLLGLYRRVTLTLEEEVEVASAQYRPLELVVGEYDEWPISWPRPPC